MRVTNPEKEQNAKFSLRALSEKEQPRALNLCESKRNIR
jgi:hypothetical protein